MNQEIKFFICNTNLYSRKNNVSCKRIKFKEESKVYWYYYACVWSTILMELISRFYALHSIYKYLQHANLIATTTLSSVYYNKVQYILPGLSRI